MPGTITFRPVEANLTHDTDWLGKMDPYCIFTLGTQKVKSQVCRHGGKRPHWEDSVTLQAEGVQSIVRVDVMDKDRFRPDDSIASTEIDLNEIQSRGQISRWYPVYHRKKLAGEILIEAAFQPTQGFIQQPLLVQNVIPTTTFIPTQHTCVQERVMTSAPIITNTQVGQTIPFETIGLENQFIGQIPTNITSGTLIQETQFSGFNNQIPLNQGLTQLPLNQGLTQLPQGGNLGYYNQDNLTTGGLNAGHTGILSSKTSAFGPQGGFPHGNHLLKGTTNAGYSERPGYTLGDVESNPTTQANLDTNGGGFFNKPGRERRAEPYALSNPGTYGIPHGQTIDTAGHLHPEVGLNKQAPIGQINQPGHTGYPDGYNNLGGAAPLNTLGGAAPLNQGNIGL